MPLAYALADIVISSSIEPEAFGRVAVEAQAMQKPIIASKLGGSMETIVNNKTGILYKFDDPRELAKNINSFMETDKLALNIMGVEGRKNVVKKFDVEKMCQSTFNEYKKASKFIMPNIQLLDGKKIPFDKKISGFDLIKKISKSLEKKALIMEVDGNLKDLSFEITKNSKVKIITADDKEGLDVLRHDAAHIMAMSVQELYPGTQVTIGPVIENGFYYDFARKEPFTSEDLKKIEKKMSEIIDRDVKTKREVWERDKAIKHFKKIGEKYKAEIIESIPKNEELSIYHHGSTWHDLCRGPHLASSGKIGKAFKLTKVSGAYWRGDSNNEMLQRIYGTCWSNKEQLNLYLERLSEAEKKRPQETRQRNGSISL